MDELDTAIMEEFFDSNNATPEERARLRPIITNPWDTEILLQMSRMMTK